MRWGGDWLVGRLSFASFIPQKEYLFLDSSLSKEFSVMFQPAGRLAGIP